MTGDGGDLILHQYDSSPFSEKIRKILAHKGLAWRAVEQPSIMPKPDLVPLTGGYRRIPVLQIGADVYCDSQLIARVLERLHPSPTIHPGASEGTCHVWNLWADRVLFAAVVSVVFAEIGEHVPKAFMEDRSKMMPGRDFSEIPKLAPYAREQLRAALDVIAAELDDGRPWLLGRGFSLADAASYHPLWFLRVAPREAALVQRFPRVAAWMERVAALGEGRRSNMEPSEALAVARAATPSPSPAGGRDAERAAGDEPNGIAPGMRVAVMPDDYGFDPVVGEVVFSSVHEIAVRRRDEALGELAVHFPRLGFRVDRA
ncbi:MAG TPA: glutathione S-transferase family protein [Candidatus Binatia bacterium]|nr:glutathione S-transferase family protein [Candidatus Binatia bacterium]